MKISHLLVMGAALSLASCGNGSNTSSESQGPDLSVQEHMRDGAYVSDSTNISYKVSIEGHDYDINIISAPDPSQPKVKDTDLDEVYMDNSVTLTIMQDGAEFFKQTFSKPDFANYIDEEYRKNGILDGFIYDEEEKDKLSFNVSISYPASDAFAPLSLTVGKDKSITIVKQTIIDEGGVPQDEKDF